MPMLMPMLCLMRTCISMTVTPPWRRKEERNGRKEEMEGGGIDTYSVYASPEMGFFFFFFFFFFFIGLGIE